MKIIFGNKELKKQLQEKQSQLDALREEHLLLINDHIELLESNKKQITLNMELHQVNNKVMKLNTELLDLMRLEIKEEEDK